MEVHTHSHTPRKHWTHYFWEFLMLFLAVFCGFLAEYQLEHKIERDREKQYIKSLVKDINSDIRHLESLDKDWESHYNASDSLLGYLADNEIFTNSYPALQLVNQSTGFPDFVSNDGTLQQLKNNGGLRLLRKSIIADSIMAYQKTVDVVNIKQQGMNDAQIKKNIITDLFDAVSFKTSIDKNNIPLMNTDKKAINSGYFYILEWRSEFQELRELGHKTKECGTTLLKAISELYGIN